LAGVLAEQHAITHLYVRGVLLAAVVTLARADGQDFALIRLFTSGIRDHDAGSGGALGFDALNDHTVVQRTNVHNYSSLIEFSLVEVRPETFRAGPDGQEAKSLLALTADEC